MELFERNKIKTAETSIQNYLERQVVTMGRERRSPQKIKKILSTALLAFSIMVPANVKESSKAEALENFVKKPSVSAVEASGFNKIKNVYLNHPQVVASIETSNELKPPVRIKIQPGLQSMQQKVSEIVLERNFLRYRNIVRKISHEYNVPPLLVHAIIQTESSYNPRAESSASAFGLMGLQPQTIKDMIDSGVIKPLPVKEYETNPILNIKAGLTYINWLKNNLYKDTPERAEKMKKEREFFDRQPQWWRLKQVLKAYNVGISNYYKKEYDPSKNTYYSSTIRNMEKIGRIVKRLDIEEKKVETARK
ncbi:MAG: transglycosylase SLT domain-containing protein [Candidatus Marsarchaeota archaeon]|nr:transglycosylase SLT domain-containing protein [Candidatus Marsarchaeota archaeon]